MSVNMRWLGTAGIELSHGGNVILLDPYLSRLGEKRYLLSSPTA